MSADSATFTVLVIGLPGGDPARERAARAVERELGGGADWAGALLQRIPATVARNLESAAAMRLAAALREAGAETRLVPGARNSGSFSVPASRVSGSVFAVEPPAAAPSPGVGAGPEAGAPRRPSGAQVAVAGARDAPSGSSLSVGERLAPPDSGSGLPAGAPVVTEKGGSVDSGGAVRVSSSGSRVAVLAAGQPPVSGAPGGRSADAGARLPTAKSGDSTGDWPGELEPPAFPEPGESGIGMLASIAASLPELEEAPPVPGLGSPGAAGDRPGPLAGQAALAVVSRVQDELAALTAASAEPPGIAIQIGPSQRRQRTGPVPAVGVPAAVPAAADSGPRREEHVANGFGEADEPLEEWAPIPSSVGAVPESPAPETQAPNAEATPPSRDPAPPVPASPDASGSGGFALFSGASGMEEQLRHVKGDEAAPGPSQAARSGPLAAAGARSAGPAGAPALRSTGQFSATTRHRTGPQSAVIGPSSPATPGSGSGSVTPVGSAAPTGPGGLPAASSDAQRRSAGGAPRVLAAIAGVVALVVIAAFAMRLSGGDDPDERFRRATTYWEIDVSRDGEPYTLGCAVVDAGTWLCRRSPEYFRRFGAGLSDETRIRASEACLAQVTLDSVREYSVTECAFVDPTPGAGDDPLRLVERITVQCTPGRAGLRPGGSADCTGEARGQRGRGEALSEAYHREWSERLVAEREVSTRTAIGSLDTLELSVTRGDGGFRRDYLWMPLGIVVRSETRDRTTVASLRFLDEPARTAGEPLWGRGGSP